MSVSVTFTIPGGEEAAKFKEKIREEATKRGQAMSELIVEAIAEFLRKQND